MTRNVFADSEPFSVAALNSMNNAHANEGVVEGAALSTGSGNWEVDVASGEVTLGAVIVDVASQTVDHSAADGSLDRVDLISVGDDGGATVTEGLELVGAGDQPIAPDVPADEVLLGAVHIRGGSSEILSGDLFGEYRTIVDTERTDRLAEFDYRGTTTTDEAGDLDDYTLVPFEYVAELVTTDATLHEDHDYGGFDTVTASVADGEWDMTVETGPSSGHNGGTVNFQIITDSTIGVTGVDEIQVTGSTDSSGTIDGGVRVTALVDSLPPTTGDVIDQSEFVTEASGTSNLDVSGQSGEYYFLMYLAIDQSAQESGSYEYTLTSADSTATLLEYDSGSETIQFVEGTTDVGIDDYAEARSPAIDPSSLDRWDRVADVGLNAAGTASSVVLLDSSDAVVADSPGDLESIADETGPLTVSVRLRRDSMSPDPAFSGVRLGYLETPHFG